LIRDGKQFSERIMPIAENPNEPLSQTKQSNRFTAA
jgi:hypothetical protein